MDKLVRWLGEQLDEDERIARAACEGGAGRWQPLGDRHGGSVAGDHDGYHVACDEGYPTLEQAAHIAEHDPARVLREIDAKRQLIARHAESDFPYNPDDGPGDYSWTAQCDGCHEDAPCTTLRILAAVYADRPGYRPEWAP